MNLKKKGLKKVSDIAVLSLVILFVLSLSLHNHAFCFDNSSVKKVSQSESAYPGHSEQSCSACRLNGNVKPHDKTNIINSHSLETLIGFLDLGVLIPSSFLVLKKSPRSPPTTI
jgi:hypothetical protein